MKSIRVGIRELREKLGEYLESSVPIEVTRHGQTVGFFVPVPKTPGQSEREAFLAAGKCMQQECQRLGISDEELVADFRAWRATKRGKTDGK